MAKGARSGLPRGIAVIRAPLERRRAVDGRVPGAQFSETRAVATHLAPNPIPDEKPKPGTVGRAKSANVYGMLVDIDGRIEI